MGKDNRTRVVIDLPNETIEELKFLSANSGRSITEEIRRAVAVAKILKDEISDGELKLLRFT